MLIWASTETQVKPVIIQFGSHSKRKSDTFGEMFRDDKNAKSSYYSSPISPEEAVLIRKCNRRTSW